MTCFALLAGTIYRASKSRNVPRPWEKWFWFFWVFLVPAMGITVHDYLYDHGLAHIFLQPIVIMGVVMLGTWAGQCASSIARLILAIGMLADFLLGIALHFGLESLVFGPPDSSSPRQTYGLLKTAIFNWQTKQSAGLTFWADHFASMRWSISTIICFVFFCALIRIVLPTTRPV